MSRRRGTDRQRDAWHVSDEDILRFIQAYPLTFRLDKCDQPWFMDLITSGGLIKKAITDERRLEAS